MLNITIKVCGYSQRKDIKMRKVLSLLVLGMFVIGFSAPTFADTTTGTAQPKVQKEGLKQGLKMVQKWY